MTETPSIRDRVLTTLCITSLVAYVIVSDAVRTCLSEIFRLLNKF